MFRQTRHRLVWGWRSVSADPASAALEVDRVHLEPPLDPRTKKKCGRKLLKSLNFLGGGMNNWLGTFPAGRLRFEQGIGRADEATREGTVSEELLLVDRLVLAPGALEFSNDGLYWTGVPDFPKFEANAATAQLTYEPIQDTSIIIPQAYLRLKFVITAAATTTATALLHADIRAYRAS